MSEVIFVRLEVHEEMYPRLHSVLAKIPIRMRSEKLRQLASISELIESGLIESLGESIQRKIALTLSQLPLDGLQPQKAEVAISQDSIDAEDFSSFDDNE